MSKRERTEIVCLSQWDDSRRLWEEYKYLFSRSERASGREKDTGEKKERERENEGHRSLYLRLIIWFLLGAVVTSASGYTASVNGIKKPELHSHPFDLHSISAEWVLCTATDLKVSIYLSTISLVVRANLLIQIGHIHWAWGKNNCFCTQNTQTLTDWTVRS